MSRYRRADIAGATYFFTVVTYRRKHFLCDADIRQALRAAIVAVRKKRPFDIDGWVLLPDHLHCVWTLPADDADFSTRWSLIKRFVSRQCPRLHHPEWMSESKRKHRESTLWQRRFYEHMIRDDTDYRRHLDYLHYNPVKHGYCRSPVDWPHSSLHRLIGEGIYQGNWGSDEAPDLPPDIGGE